MNDNFQFNPSFFKNNRQALQKKRDLSAPIVIGGNGLIQRTRDDDTFPFQQSANFWYLTGINEPDMVLVIHKDDEFVILPARDRRYEIFSGGFDKQKIAGLSGIKNIYPSEEGWQRLSEILKKCQQASTFKPGPGYDRNYYVFTNPAPARLIKKLKTINKNIRLNDIRSDLADMRSIKSKDEISAIKQAINHTAKAYSLISDNYDNFKNEREIEAELVYYGSKNGLSHAFSPIIANGKNACTLHYHANQAAIDKDLPTLIDIGYSANGYCADLTRVICPRPNKRQETIYQAVLDVHKYAMGLLKPGVMPQEYEKGVAKFAGEKMLELGLIKTIEPKSVFKYFRHRTSHFLGIDVHDVGDYSKAFEPGMVVTVEPGIYIDEELIGVRIEDDVLITAAGCVNLSAGLSRELNSIKIKP